MRNLKPANLLLLAILSAASFSVLAHGDKEHKTKDQPAKLVPAKNSGIQVAVQDGWVTSGPEVIKVKRGDQVVITFTSNQADELHLHGYDITVPLTANTPATLSFIAEHPGRFGYELHHVHREIGAIEVHP